MTVGNKIAGRPVGWFLVVAGLLLLSGCSVSEKIPPTIPGQPPPYKIGDTWYQPMNHAKGYRERGIASWYGEDFHGKKTSNGETYDMYAMTAAHKTLPLGTYVKVRNLDNDETVVVRVNDRGPFVRGRIIDMSYTSAKKLGLVDPGTARVEVIALGTPATRAASAPTSREQTYLPGNYYAGKFFVQVGAYMEQSNALRIKEKLGTKYQDAHIVVHESSQGTWYRVRAAKSTNLDEARRYEQLLEQDGFADAMVVAE